MGSANSSQQHSSQPQSSQPQPLVKGSWGGWDVITLPKYTPQPIILQQAQPQPLVKVTMPKYTPQQMILIQQAQAQQRAFWDEFAKTEQARVQAQALAQQQAQQSAGWASFINAWKSRDAELAKAWRADISALAQARTAALARNSKIPQVPGIASTLLANDLCQSGNL